MAVAIWTKHARRISKLSQSFSEFCKSSAGRRATRILSRAFSSGNQWENRKKRRDAQYHRQQHTGDCSPGRRTFSYGQRQDHQWEPNRGGELQQCDRYQHLSPSEPPVRFRHAYHYTCDRPTRLDKKCSSSTPPGPRIRCRSIPDCHRRLIRVFTFHELARPACNGLCRRRNTPPRCNSVILPPPCRRKRQSRLFRRDIAQRHVDQCRRTMRGRQGRAMRLPLVRTGSMVRRTDADFRGQFGLCWRHLGGVAAYAT